MRRYAAVRAVITRSAVVRGAATVALAAALAGCSGGGIPSAAPPGPSTPARSSSAPDGAAAPTPSPASSAVDGAAAPVLGSSSTGPKGYGTARPSEIDGGQDSSGVLEGVRWSTWGASRATGSGTASYAGPGQALAEAVPEQATVVAFDLGTCGGKPAYRKLTWYFPQHGQHLDTGGALDVCAG